MKYLLLFTLFFSSLAAFDITKVDVLAHKVANAQTALLKFSAQKNISYKYVKVGKKRFEIFDSFKKKSEKYTRLRDSFKKNEERKKYFFGNK